MYYDSAASDRNIYLAENAAIAMAMISACLFMRIVQHAQKGRENSLMKPKNECAGDRT